jgi:hypothetical protein
MAFIMEGKSDIAMSAVTQIVGGFTYELGHLRYDVF